MKKEKKAMRYCWLFLMFWGCVGLGTWVVAQSKTIPTPRPDPKPNAKITKEAAQSVNAVNRALPDGAELVFIPAGEFRMGSTKADLEADIKALLAVDKTLKREDLTSEIGQHKVYLDGYYIAKTPVTVKQYLAFCAVTGHAKPVAPDFNANWSKEEHPIVNVSWDDAVAYCAWVSKESGLKVSLPTEAQCEKAARGADGRKYPWGSTWDGSKCANSVKPNVLHGTMAAGSYPHGASPYGVLDMAGNVWQWCADYYGESYYASSPKNNPLGPGNGQYRVLRGGSCCDYYGIGFRCACRSRIAPVNRDYVSGFRCVVSGQ